MKTSRVARRVYLSGLAVLAASLAGVGAAAQTAPLVFPRDFANLTVAPAVADAGTARELRIAGLWMNGCVPVGAKVAFTRFSGPAATPVVTVELQEPQTLVACTLAITPYEQRVTFTPTVRGLLRVVIVTRAGRFLGEGVIDVREASDHRSLADITGVWYDPTTNGSGLTFIHSAADDNTVFGTWYVYGNDGVARWFTIQNARWSAQGRLLRGDLYETRGQPASCAPLPACPVPHTTLNLLGQAQMSFGDANTARIEAFAPGGAPLFASNLQRIQF
jgi:hypothetical protein